MEDCDYNGLCIDRWYVMGIFSCLTQAVSMYFDGLFDCSNDHFNRRSLNAAVRSRTYSIDVKGVGGGGVSS